jgi:hypothetical protein
MINKPEKPPVHADAGPSTGGEITWIAILLALCLMANAWVVGPGSEAANKPKPAPVAVAPAAPEPSLVIVPDRPDRDRPDGRERPWRDPLSSSLAGF